MDNKYYYSVCLYSSGGREIYTLKNFTTLQNARKFIKKEQQCVRMGIPIKDGFALRIYKMDKATHTPITIYLN